MFLRMIRKLAQEYSTKYRYYLHDVWQHMFTRIHFHGMQNESFHIINLQGYMSNYSYEIFELVANVCKEYIRPNVVRVALGIVTNILNGKNLARLFITT